MTHSPPTPNPIPIPKAAHSFQSVTLERVKQQLKISPSVSGFDAELTSLILEGIQWTEERNKWIGADRSFSWSPMLHWPKERMPIRNVTAITQIDYIDTDGNPQVLDSATYTLDLSSLWPHLALVDQSSAWPDVDGTAVTPYTVTFDAGAADINSVDEQFTSRVTKYVDDRFENRESGISKIQMQLEANEVSTYL